MLKNITLGQYFPGDTVVHRLDPRIKILVALLFLVAVFVVRTMWGFFALAVLFILIIALAKIGPVTILRSIRPLLFIIIFTFVLNILFYSGQTIYWQWGFLTISKEGIEKAVFIAIRLVLLIVATSLLTLTTSPMQLTDGMESLLSPLKKIKFPVHELAIIMSIALRLIPTLVEETDKIQSAQKARCADFESGNVFKRAKAMIPVLIPLFVSSFRRADDLADAMDSRCYRGAKGRTRMKKLKVHFRDFAALFVMCVFFFAVLYPPFPG